MIVTYLNLILNLVTLAIIVVAYVKANRRIKKADRILDLAVRHGELSDAAYQRINSPPPPPGP